MISQTDTSVDSWEEIVPQVNSEHEFYEIVHDFGNTLELVREAISNSIDAHASWIKISFTVEEIEGSKRLVVTLFDNGEGMAHDVISKDFWGLGHSQFRERKDAIGEKGHGTKIYLRSESITVRTQHDEVAYESICSRPLSDLTAKRLHKPKLKTIERFLPHNGTEIRIVGYNDNERSKFVQDIVKDYILWYTKVGSIEHVFGIDNHNAFKVYLKCLDVNDYEEVSFGHPFPDENADINKLFNEKGAGAADWYVKRYVWKGERLANHPEVIYDAVISVEGDEVKRSYNPLLGERRRFETGRFRMSDRFGIYLCKDYIPVVRVNEWITGFGSGSNAYVLLHGFINCQSLNLTANRGDIANTDPLILDEIRSSVKKLIDKVDKELNDKGIYTLRQWQEEERTLQQEKSEFTRRVKNLQSRRSAKIDGHTIVEPRNEAELFGLFMIVYTLHRDLFDFDPLDYNASIGIDILARNKSENLITEGQNWYVELKHTLQAKRFNHAFQYLRWIVCWDFDKNIARGCDMRGVEENDIRQLQSSTDNDGNHIYFLDSQKKAGKVQIIRLKEFLQEKLGIEFK